MFYYAQINESGICIGISSLNQEINNPEMIMIESYNVDYLWRKYENEQWSKEKYEPIVEKVPTTDEKINELQELIQSQQMQDLVLMDINLTLYEELLNIREQLSLLTDKTENA